MTPSSSKGNGGIAAIAPAERTIVEPGDAGQASPGKAGSGQAGPDRSNEDMPNRGRAGLAAGALAALGIVYGDLGTSPLYSIQPIIEALGGKLTGADALGALSLVFWALIIVISVKYCLLVMRADNHGEGGILALVALIGGARPGTGHALVLMGVFGAALIYGDGIITPAISVLSALEGVNVATSALKPYVLPAAVLILLGLFAAQSFGTAAISKIFGPVMLIWFATIALLGALAVTERPEVLFAANPLVALEFLGRHGVQSLFVLGGVFLALTGGEALYADMGHFGRVPIQFSWYAIVLPALLLNYAGQTAHLIAHPGATENPFFQLAPHWAIFPLVGLAMLATIIASQAIITGAYSLTRQAMQLNWFPALGIRQTSDEAYGQIYVPVINWIMMVATVALTVSFGSSDRLAAAYGTAVSTTMLLTTALLFTVMRERWGWSLAAALPTAALFLIVDLAFVAANLLKIAEGGWIPLAMGALIFTVMLTWHQGVTVVGQRLTSRLPTPETFLRRLAEGKIVRVPGTGVFLTRSGTAVSPLMEILVDQLGALQKTVVALNVAFEEIPRVPAARRLTVTHVADGYWFLSVRFGFMENPNIPAALAAAGEFGCNLDLAEALYLGSRYEAFHTDTDPIFPAWQANLFAFLARNSVRVDDVFDLPRDRFVSIGRQIGI